MSLFLFVLFRCGSLYVVFFMCLVSFVLIRFTLVIVGAYLMSMYFAVRRFILLSSRYVVLC